MKKGDIVCRKEQYATRYYIVLKCERQNVIVARICSGIIQTRVQYKMPKDVLHKCTCIATPVEKVKLKSIMKSWPNDIVRPYEKWANFSAKLDKHATDKHLIIKLYCQGQHFYVTVDYWSRVARPVRGEYRSEYRPFFKLRNVNPVY